MNNLHPIISIIVPVYNTEQYLAKCLDSIVAQTFTDFEVLMIDDGSTDGSGEICDQYSQFDNRFIAIHQTNQGVSASRNNGLKRARGSYISFIDSDDYIHPQMLDLLYMAVCQGDYDFAMVYNKIVEEYITEFQSIDIPNLQKLYPKDLICNILGNSDMDGQYIVCTNKLYKKDLLKEVYFSEFKIAEDLVFNFKLFHKVNKAVLLKHDLYYYWKHETSAMYNVSEKYYLDRLNAYWECFNWDSSGTFREACYLIKLYKVLFSIRLQSRKAMYYNNISKRIDEIYKHVCGNFLKNRFIPISRKVLFMVLYYVPLTYKAFISFCEWKAKKIR